MRRLVTKRQAAVREECEHRFAVLWQDQERQHFLARSRDIGNYLLPQAGRMLGETDNKAAESRWRHIIDTSGTDALNIATAGLMTYATPPGGEWRSLVLRGMPNPSDALKVWLDQTDDEMEDVLGQSNAYQALYLLYRDLIGFGQGCAIVDFDPQYVLWCYQVQIGDYALAASFRGQIDTLYRELTMPLRQVVKRWGAGSLPQNLRSQWEEKKSKAWEIPVRIVHAIEPRPEQYLQDEEAKQKRLPRLSIEKGWRSVYWVKDSSKEDGLLSEMGYEHFPVLAPRYDTLAGGVYGWGPGCMALAHLRSLQHRQYMIGRLSAWQCDPMTVADTRLEGQPMGPGQTVYIDNAQGKELLSPITPGGDPALALAEVNDIRRMVRSAMGADVYSVVSSLQGGNVREEHIRSLVQEKFTLLGPQTARSFDELPRPLVDLAYSYMERAGRVPELPPEIAQSGGTIDVEFRGVLAHAAMNAKRAATDSFLMGIAQYAEFFPEMRNKVRAFDAATELHETSGAAPNLLRSDEEAERLTQAEAAARAEEAEAVIGAERAKAAKDAGSVKTDERNVVSDAMGAA